MPLETDAPLKNPLRQKKERKFADPVLECYVTFFTRLSSCSLWELAVAVCIEQGTGRMTGATCPLRCQQQSEELPWARVISFLFQLGALPWRCTQHDAIFIAVLTHFFFQNVRVLHSCRRSSCSCNTAGTAGSTPWMRYVQYGNKHYLRREGSLGGKFISQVILKYNERNASLYFL